MVPSLIAKHLSEKKRKLHEVSYASEQGVGVSIHLPEEAAKTHSVQFLVYSRLAVSDPHQLGLHLKEHLAFQKKLYTDGVLGVSGPFFTEEGKNSGNGLYVLRVDSIEHAHQLAAEDPLHRAGIRTATVEPWLEAIHE